MPTCIRVYALAICVLLSFTVSAADTVFEEIEWTSLMPEDDLDALLNPPEYFTEIKDGSEQDSLDAFRKQKFEDKNTQRFKDALISTRVVAEYDGKPVRIPGYIVPLEQNEKQQVTAFFIVPYFGACLHMPPPPPNQIIFVSNEEGVVLDSLEQAFWFEGRLHIETSKHDLGKSAYTMVLNDYQTY